MTSMIRTKIPNAFEISNDIFRDLWFQFYYLNAICAKSVVLKIAHKGLWIINAMPVAAEEITWIVSGNKLVLMRPTLFWHRCQIFSNKTEDICYESN